MNAPPCRLAVWCSADQSDLIRRVVAVGRFELVGLCAVDGVQTAPLARTLGTSVVDDPRQLASLEVDALWLAADGELAPETLALLAASGNVVASALHPATLAAHTLSFRAGSRATSAPRPAPLCADLLLGDGGDELLRQFGAIEGACVSLGASTALGGLGARVLDLADLALRTIGVPETVLASFVPAAGGSGIERDDLRGLAGTMSVQMRGPAATIAAILSTRVRDGWRASFLGPAGRLDAGPRAVAWFDPDGAQVDEHRPAPDVAAARSDDDGATALDSAGSVSDPMIAAIAALATALRRGAAAQREGATEIRTVPAIDLVGALAVCEAVRLSCRTGSPESPAALMETLAAPRSA